MQLLFNFGNTLVFIVNVIDIYSENMQIKKKVLKYDL